MIKYAKNARQEKKSGRNVNSLDIKIIDCITDAENAINYALSHQIKQLEIFQFCINFARVTKINFSYY